MRAYFIRLALAVVCLALLYHFDLLRFESLAALYHRPALVGASALLLFVTIPLSAYRWHLLLWCQGFRLPFRKTFEVVLVGLFFSTFLPGSYGGDIVRAGYIYHGARQQTGTLLMSILIDRVSGLAGLIVLGFAAQFALPAIIDLRITAFMLALAAIAVLGSFFLPALGRLAATVFRHFGSRLGDQILALSMQIRSAIMVYQKRGRILAAAVAISIVQFGFSLAAFVVIAGAFDFVTVAPVTIVYAGIVAIFANSLPLTPGGIGVGEAAFANAVTVIDPSATGPYATIFLTMRALTLLLSLLGGPVFLVYRTEIIEYTDQAHSHAKKP